MSVCALNDDPFRFDVKLCELFLLGVVIVVVVTGIDTDLNLRVKSRIYFICRVEAVAWKLERGHTTSSRELV
jgi:hypothetical protein